MSEPDPSAAENPLDNAPSAASASPAADCGETPCPQPVTAWTSPEDSRALAQGLRMRDNPAEWAFARLSRLIEEFESRLDKDEEIGVRLVGLPGEGMLQIEDVGFWGPDMILFFGRNADGKPVRLIQHYTQFNVLLGSAPKKRPEPARRIGFQLRERMEKAIEDGAT